MFYLGTWEIGDLDSKSLEEIINYSFGLGIKSYDTAMVYGGGKVETALGEISSQDLEIITKIPAQTKPTITEDKDIQEVYSKKYISEQIQNSLNRLRRKRIHAILLHNWCYAWEQKYLDNTIEILRFLKSLSIADYVGISLPNNYNGQIHNSKIIKQIDIIECPLNKQNRYLVNNLTSLKNNLKEIVARSLLKDDDSTTLDISKTIIDQSSFCVENGISFTIGSQNQEHIKDNLNLINRKQ